MGWGSASLQSGDGTNGRAMNEATFKTTIASTIQKIFTRIVTVGTVTTTIVDVPVIFAEGLNTNDGNPRPPYPFITISIISVVQAGEAELGELDEEGVLEIGSQKIATISVDYFGANPIENLAKAVIGLEKKTILGHLIGADLAFVRTTQIQNLTGLAFDGSLYEEHANFDLQIGFVDTSTDDVGLIEEVWVEKTIEAGGHTITGTEIIEID